MSFLQVFRVYDVPYTRIRLGSPNDGGYVLLDEIAARSKALYTYGVDDDVRFELDFVKRYPETNAHLFDHTVESISVKDDNIFFTREGISKWPGDETNTLEHHLASNGDLDTPKTLKMDIEWNEWDVFENMPADVLDSFDQILCEFHLVPIEYNGSHTEFFTGYHKDVYAKMNWDLFARYSRILRKIQSYYYIYHVHINNSLPLADVLGAKVPQLVEVSMVNRKLVPRSILTDTKFPVEGLDSPNKPWKDDVVVEWNKP